MKKQLRIGAYLRVSTDKQVQVFEGSLYTQKYRMQEFVKNKNKENKNWGTVIDFYIDEGLSAGTVNRPQYQRMMKDVRSEKINLILVADISRLSRNVHDFSVLLKELEDFNASYMSMKEQFDSTTPAGRLMINMVVNMAQFEREQTSERVSINCNSRAMRGFVNGGRTPFGFDRHDEQNGTFTVNENEAEQLKIIFNTVRDQGSVGKTIPIIESLKIFPKLADKRSDPEKSKKWGYGQLKALLTNPIYIGVKEVNKKHKNADAEYLKPWELYQKVKASWSAIIDEKLFNEVNDILEENLKLERRRILDTEKRIFLLSGILSCGECGKPLCGQSAHGANQVHRYYAHSYKRNSGIKCSVKRIRADNIEQAVINHLTEIVGRVGYFENLELKMNETSTSSPSQIANEIQLIKKAVIQTDEEISSTFKLQLQINQGTEASQLTAEHLDKLGKQKKILLNRVLELEEMQFTQKDSSEIRNDIENNVIDFKKGFKKAPPTMRRRLIHKVLGKLIYTAKGIETHFKFSEHRNTDISKPFENTNDKITPFRAKKIANSNLVGTEESLILSFQKLLVDGVGWGTWTRTME